MLAVSCILQIELQQLVQFLAKDDSVYYSTVTTATEDLSVLCDLVHGTTYLTITLWSVYDVIGHLPSSLILQFQKQVT